MAEQRSLVVIGGTTGVGNALARAYADRGFKVYLTGRSQEKAEAAAAEIGAGAVGIGVDLTRPETIAEAVAPIGSVDYLTLVAVLRDDNKVRTYNIAGATKLVMMKMVGYTEVIHALVDRLHDRSSIVLYGGLAKERPYVGATTVATVNGGVTSLIRPLALELAPIRVNAIHPAIIGDSWFWEDKPEAVLEGFRVRTPIGRLITQDEVVDATRFLLENEAMNGQNLFVDGGWLLT